MVYLYVKQVHLSAGFLHVRYTVWPFVAQLSFGLSSGAITSIIFAILMYPILPWMMAKLFHIWTFMCSMQIRAPSAQRFKNHFQWIMIEFNIFRLRVSWNNWSSRTAGVTELCLTPRVSQTLTPPSVALTWPWMLWGQGHGSKRMSYLTRQGHLDMSSSKWRKTAILEILQPTLLRILSCDWSTYILHCNWFRLILCFDWPLFYILWPYVLYNTLALKSLIELRRG